ncbi:MAG: ubiquinol-cytochrome c reductase cytochrome c subunit [Solirubrobacteraceae bacterium]|jgi:ubiquinol-cytochrome c reductase cytochrome c subunit|nr:ubiquinol-cytochrome c reductase cytochrome c subunit [Solirubrobacteraceae bacterium]
MRRGARRVAIALAVVCGGLAAWAAAAGGQQQPPPPARGTADVALAQRGRDLYAGTCSICHGEDLRGVRGQGPSLLRAGAAATDFYLSTGRMPIADPTDEPTRAEPQYSKRDIAALVAYVGSFGGPALPNADPRRGDIARGKETFTESCAGCHQVMARGGIVTGAFVPALQGVSPRQIAEAVRVGPYLMPVFDEKRLSQADLDDLAAYVGYTAKPDDRGGWGIGNIGPVPEGMITWLLAAVALLGIARALGERAT